MNALSKRQTDKAETSVGDLIKSSPVAHAFKAVGDRWTWLILRDLFLGYRRFEDLRRRTGAARGTLTARLNSLVENGILYRNPYQLDRARFEYRLTDKGFGIYPVALLVWRWEQKWTDEHEEIPEALTHRGCGKKTVPTLRCAECQEEIHAVDVTFSAGPGINVVPAGNDRSRRRHKSRDQYPAEVDRVFFHAVDVIGDRWAGLVLASIWFGLHRYDDITDALGIATNILADRLKRLTECGVLERRAYQDKPKRYEYRLTPKGRDLYGLPMMLHQWASDWLVGEKGPGVVLTHQCGKPLRGFVACSECGEKLRPGEVTYGTP